MSFTNQSKQFVLGCLISLSLLQAYANCKVDYPIISDPTREIAVKLGMVDPVEKDKAGLPLTCRAVSWMGFCHCYQVLQA